MEKDSLLGNLGDMVYGTPMVPKLKEGTGDRVYVLRLDLKTLFPLGQYATVFQVEVRDINNCFQENIKWDFKRTRIRIYTGSQTAIKALI